MRSAIDRPNSLMESAHLSTKTRFYAIDLRAFIHVILHGQNFFSNSTRDKNETECSVLIRKPKIVLEIF
jgi:hypothetical protein